MIKIHIKEPEGEKCIPIPYFAVKGFLLKANEVTGNSEEHKKAASDLIKVLRTFAKKNPGFVLVDIHDKEGTEVKITL